MATADRSDTHATDDTSRLKTPGPCQRVIYYGLYDAQLPDEWANIAVRQEICGGRWWRGPILNPDWERYGLKKYTAQCRKCGTKVGME